MSERITSIEIDTISEDNRHMLVFTGLSYDVSQGDDDARITKVTGLEAPTMNVTGGSSSFGGSVFTGVTLGDREVVLTAKPAGLTNKEIKNRLNALIGRSTRNPLVFRVNTEREDGTKSRLTSEAYISNVSSPIFDKDDTIQVTLKMPNSYLERGALMLGRWGGGLSTPVPLSVRHSQIAGEYHTIGYTIPLTLSDDALNTDSPFSFVFNLDDQSSMKLLDVVIRDGDMNKIIINVGGIWDRSSYGSIKTFRIEYNGRGRSVDTQLLILSQAPGAPTTPQAVSVNGQPDYSYFIEPTWPSLNSESSEINVDLTLGGQYNGDVIDAIDVERVLMWPRVLGV